MNINGVEKPFLCYGFDIQISPKDSFTLVHILGIFFLHLEKENSTQITARRRIISGDIGEQCTTESFDVRSLSTKQKEELIKDFLYLEMSHADIARHLGLSPSYLGNFMRKNK